MKNPHSKILVPAFILLSGMLLNSCNSKPTIVRIDVTTDVHGMIFPVDLISNRPADHSLAQVSTYIHRKATSGDTSLILLDNGDLLQGQPTVYYFNTLKTDTMHLSARVMNYMGYKAGTVGNHDIETGPDVYYRVRDEFAFPWLGANVVDSASGEPVFTPYTVLRAGKRKIAVLGLTTPGVPNWLPKSLWPGLEFRDMVETAKKWVPVILEKEKPDLLIGLFHAGTDFTYGHQEADTYLNQNATVLVAREVPGFDIIFAGHDHERSVQWVHSTENDSVLIVDPGSHATLIGEVLVEFSGKKGEKKILNSGLIPVKDLEPDPEFMDRFGADLKEVRTYLSDTITILGEELRSIDGLFGPSAFTGLIQQIQMNISGAPVSFTAPLTFNTTLNKGPVLVSDMFKLYRFENMLYKMKLTGAEIDGFLEHAAALWFNRMTGPGDHLLLFDPDKPGRLKNQYYNFSSAAGIRYTIDLQKPAGDRVNILSMEDGSPFSLTDTFEVAVNSYRGNGGGGHLTLGAGIPADELASRIVWSTDLDLRYYMMQYMLSIDTLKPVLEKNWELVPSGWAVKAGRRDFEQLTSKN